MPAKNDDAYCLKNRGAFFAGKPRSYRFCVLVESPNKKVEREFEGMLYNFRVFFDRMTFPNFCEVSYDCYHQYRLRRRFSSQRPDR